MKLLLWACIVCAAFAKKRLHFIGEKFPSSSEEGYKGNRHPLNPSLNIPYPIPNNDVTPSYYAPRNNFPNHPWTPNSDTGVSPYPWIRTVPGAINRIPSFLLPTWLAPPPSSPPGASPHVPPSSTPVRAFGSPNEAAAKLEPLAATPPAPEVAAVDPAVIEPDEVEPAVATLPAAICAPASPAAAIPPAASLAAAIPPAASSAAFEPDAPEPQLSPFPDQVKE
nr:PREDICTED: proline-rich protein 27 isoform X1 [Equus przewalskii]